MFIVQYYNLMWGKQDYLKLDVLLFDVIGNIEVLFVFDLDLIIGVGEVDVEQYEFYFKVVLMFCLLDDVFVDMCKILILIVDLFDLSDKVEQVFVDYDDCIVDVKVKLNEVIGEEKIVVLRMNVVDKLINIFGIYNMFVG